MSVFLLEVCSVSYPTPTPITHAHTQTHTHTHTRCRSFRGTPCTAACRPGFEGIDMPSTLDYTCGENGKWQGNLRCRRASSAPASLRVVASRAPPAPASMRVVVGFQPFFLARCDIYWLYI